MVNTFFYAAILICNPNSIDGCEFNPIPKDTLLGILKIPIEEILDDLAILEAARVAPGEDYDHQDRDELRRRERQRVAR